jgi:hypothetical protein
MATFNFSEYSPYAREGTGVLTGQAFLRTRGGDVKYAAGREVTLNPVTAYSTEWYNRGVIAGKNLEEADARATPYNRVCTADGEGRFRFEKLPTGDYYVVSSVFWEIPGAWGLRRTGGNVYAQVHVTEGQTNELILTQ